MGGDPDVSPEDLKKVAKIMSDEQKRMAKVLNRAVQKYVDKFDVAESFYYDQGALRAEWAYALMEVCCGADFPKHALLNKASRSVKNLQSVVKSRKWKQVQDAFAAAEKDVNIFHKAVNDYYNDMQSGGAKTITILKWTKTAGFISLGVLATTFVGGPMVAVKMGLDGYRGAAVAAAVGGVLKEQVDMVATTVGRELAGEDVSYSKLAWNHLWNTLGAAAIGALLQGPPAKWLSGKVADAVGKEFIENAGKEAVMSRLTVSMTRTMLLKWSQSEGKPELKKAATKVSKQLKGKQSQDDVMRRVLSEATKSKSWRKFVEKQLQKQK